MYPTLLQAQVRVIFIGLLWIVPYLIIARELSPVALFPFLLGFPILVSFFAAILTGRFDSLAIMTLLIPAAFNFVFETDGD